MPTLLRIEAVNLRYVISDTEDLSTRRGGSFMLLDAINDISQAFAKKLKPISTGASIGLFEVIQHTTELQSEVEAFLQQKNQSEKKPYCHATFTVSQVQDPDFRAVVEKALAANRWQQLRHLNFVSHWGESAPSVCPLDAVRPASSHSYLPGQQKSKLSHSVADRRKAGRDLRQTVYQRILQDKQFDLSFTNDTESLSTFDPDQYPELPANLNGKMAVFYADGNSFGKIQRDCKTPNELLDWDQAIKNKRQALLKDLLAWLQTNGRSHQGNDLRFETLLWGGDELLFLLPAWLGLAFARQFFALTKNWTYKEKPLKHATGLVFAKHSTPISSLQTLAKQLAEHGKQNDETRKANTLSWVVLESFDNTGNQLDAYWQRNGIFKDAQGNDGWQQLLLSEDRLDKLCAMQPLKEALPRSALIRVLRSIAAGQYAKENALIQRSYASARAALPAAEQQAVLTALWAAFGVGFDSPPEDAGAVWAQQQAVPWTALLELWDYILPPVACTANRQTTSPQEVA
ncbi:MAG: hypothetical protein RLZZ352_1708 [Pseudomonadota bacterium]|jgi:hypothetical protein